MIINSNKEMDLAIRRFVAIHATTEKLMEMYLVAGTGSFEQGILWAEIERRNLDNIIVDYCACNDGDNKCVMHLENVYGNKSGE